MDFIPRMNHWLTGLTFISIRETLSEAVSIKGSDIAGNTWTWTRLDLHHGLNWGQQNITTSWWTQNTFIKELWLHWVCWDKNIRYLAEKKPSKKARFSDLLYKGICIVSVTNL